MGISIYFFFEINLDSNKNFSPLLESKLISKKKTQSLAIISTYSNEITHIYICMKLERHKDSKNN